MKLFFDFSTIILFFIVYKFFGIYIATGVAMAMSVLQVIFYRLKFQRYEKMHIISMGFWIILGGATMFFHNPLFVKWKPTVFYWFLSLALLSSHFVSSKPLIQKVMEANVQLSSHIWYKLNTIWCVFFLVMGALNLYIAYNYETDVWFYFKIFGFIGITLLFVLLQAFYLTKHMDEKVLEKP